MQDYDTVTSYLIASHIDLGPHQSCLSPSCRRFFFSFFFISRPFIPIHEISKKILCFEVFWNICIMGINQMNLNLVQLIQKHEIKISQLAKSIRISPRTFSKWIQSTERYPRTFNIIKRLSSYSQISIHDLKYGKINPPSNPGIAKTCSDYLTVIIQIKIYQIKIE